MFRTAALATLAVAALAGCRSSGTSAVPQPTRVVAEAADGVGPIVYDPNQMADFPCHGMGTTLMGSCTDDELAALARIVRAKGGKGIVELPKPGGAEGSPGGASATSSGDSAVAGAAVRDLGDGIVFDPNAMKDVPCHAMFDIIMGRCTDAEIERLAQELRARRGSGGDPKPAAATILPGDSRPGVVRSPQLSTTTLDLADGARFEMAATVITRTIGGRAYPGYGYNDEVGGPILRVAQGSSVTVDFTNRIDMPTTVHWHGLRHANKDDGVPGVTQPAIEPGGGYTYTLSFPDPGIYWYHPHVREDIQQDGGMYGVILVTPSDPDYFNPVDREEVLVLDDLFIEDGKLVPFGKEKASFAVMGRFGNTMLVNGRDDYRLAVRQGDVARFYVVNVANVRPFRFAFEGARMKRVGGDLGKYTEDAYVDSVLIAPAERAIVEVRFDRPGEVALVNETPERRYALGRIDVSTSATDATLAGARRSDARVAFDTLRVNTEIVADMARYLGHARAEPDINLELDIDMPGLLTAAAGHGTAEGAGPPAGGHAGGQWLAGRRQGRRGRGRMGGRHAGGEPPVHRRRDPLGAARHGLRRRERGSGVLVQGGGPREDPHRQPSGQRPPDAAPDPHPRPALPDRRPQRTGEPRPGLEGHRARADRRDGRHPDGRDEPGRMDGPLPHRRTSRDRDDVPVRRHRGGRHAPEDVRILDDPWNGRGRIGAAATAVRRPSAPEPTGSGGPRRPGAGRRPRSSGP
ncbi:MAG: multicopper oxidase domain-containing protein [Anaerolineae bacterium]